LMFVEVDEVDDGVGDVTVVTVPPFDEEAIFISSLEILTT